MFSYAHLELTSDSGHEVDLDPLTVRSHITSALTQFLGLSGSAIPVDILKLERSRCWIRTQRDDLSPFIAAVGGWIGRTDTGGKIGWKVRGTGNWLNVLMMESEKTWNE